MGIVRVLLTWVENNKYILVSFEIITDLHPWLHINSCMENEKRLNKPNWKP